MLTKIQKKHLNILSKTNAFIFPEIFSYSSCSGKIFPFKIDISKSYRKAIQDLTSIIQEKFEFDVIVGRKNKGDCFSKVIGPWLDKDDATINGNKIAEGKLNNKKILCIDDIIYTGYSMENSWIPTVKENNGKIIGACFYINEESGNNKMKELKIPYQSLITLNTEAWDYLYKKGAFTKNQYREILDWRKNKDNWALKKLTQEKGLDYLLKLKNGTQDLKRVAEKIIQKAYPQHTEQITESINKIIDTI